MWLVVVGASLLVLLSATSASYVDEVDYNLPELPTIEEMAASLGDFKLETLADLDAYAEAIRRLARLQISKSFSAEARRYKRELDTKSANVTGLDLYAFNLTEKEDGSSWINRVTGFEVLVHEGKVYFITAGPSTDNVAVMVLNSHYELDVVAKFKLGSTPFDKIDLVTAAVDGGIMWLALGTSSSRLVTIVCIHLSSGEVKYPQNIPTTGVLGALHMFKVADSVYLVVGERFHSSPDDSVGVSEIYMLMGRYFDRRDSFSLECTGVYSISGFHEGRSYIIVLGMNNEKGVHVYQLDPMADQVTLVQELREVNVLQVVHYIDAHDFKHYIIVRSNGNPANIYWWDNSQLVQWQLLQTGPLTRFSFIGYITLSNLETVIFVAERGVVTVFADDLTGHYYQTFSVVTGCSSILDIHGVRTGSTYLINYICVGDVNRIERRVLTFQEVNLVSAEDQGDTLLKCLNELNSTLESRKTSIAYLEDVVNNDRIMSTDHNQVWSGPVVFTELTVTSTTYFTQTVNIINLNGPNATTPQSLTEYEDKVSLIEVEVAAVQAVLPSVLYFSGDQTITGPINASTLVIDNLDIDFLEISSLNGFKVDNLDSTFLIDGIDQTISGRWNVGYLSTDKLDTRLQGQPGRLNGLLTSELMRKSISNQIVTGNHSYSTVIVGEVCNSLCNGFPVEINGVDTSTIVTQGSDVTFLAKKTFSNIIINGELTADLINGIDIKELSSRVIYTDDPSTQTLDGQYTLDRVEVRGNVEAATINGVDLRKLDDSVVKTRGNYRLPGGLVYSSDLVVSGSLLTDAINDISWSDVVDLNSPDLISGIYHFTDATILGSLVSDDINGLDFSQDVALTDKQQTINGRITFTQSVEVNGPEGVLMEQGGTVNGVDPSKLQFQQDSLEQIVVTEEIVLTGPLNIDGNVIAKSINGLILEGIEERYWSRTRDQVITNPVHLNDAVFNGPVTVATLNGRELSDYLHNYGNEIVTGNYRFLGIVRVKGDLLMDPGRTVDGVDVSELKKNVVTLAGHQTITGQITFQGKLTVVGDLDLAGKINGIDIARDLMRLDQSLHHTGRLTFTSKTIITILDIVNGDLTLQTLNGLDVAAAADDLILVDEDAVITGGGGLQFTGQVKVNELFVSRHIDGVDLDELSARALLKNSNKPQVIDGRLLVGRDVEFLGGLTLDRVNGKVWSDHLNNVVPLDYSGFVSGRKIFTQPIDINGDFNPSTINGINIARLASRILRRTGEQTIDGFYTFNGDISANAFFAPVIDGVDMGTIRLVDVAGNVSGTVVFAEDVHLLNGLTSDHFVLDGCNVKELEETAVMTDKGEVDITGDVTVDKLVIRGSATSAGNIFAGALDLLHFLDTLVLRSSDQIITAPVQFGDVKIDNLNTRTINNVDINELLRVAALMNEDNVINCDLKFTNGVRVGSLFVRSSLSGRSGGGILVNGIDLSDIAARAVLATGGTVLITGTKTFLNGFIVNELVVAGSIGGVPVSSLVVLSRTDILASGITFAAPITVRGNLQVTGLVDGVNLADFINNRITLNSTQTMFTSCTFESIRVEGDLEINKINDVVLSDLVIRSAASQTITGIKTFLGGLHVNGNIVVDTINGIDITELAQTLIRKDVDATLNFQVTFNSVVTSTVDVFVTGKVNGFDLSELNAGALSDLLFKQYLRIDEIRSQFGSITEDNYESAREMYAALSYLDRVNYPRDTNVTGSLWVGRIPEVGPGLYLKITTCTGPVGQLCGCDAECHYFEVTDDARLLPYVQLGYKVNILGHGLSTNLHIAIYSGCFEGVPGAQVRVVYADGNAGFVQRLSLGLVSDSGLFVVDGISYIVTVSQFLHENDDSETTAINVLTPLLGSRTISIVWSKTTTLNAVDLDLILIDNNWYLLVTNNYDSSNYVDPYSAKSQLYVWNKNARTFQLKGEYMADHATSGMFISIAEPVQEYFFCLTQYKSADFSIYEDNLQFTTNILIYRYNKATKEFESFQHLDVNGAMGQTLLRVDNNYYLLFISAEYNRLYVYQYYHAEGFVLYSSLRVNTPHSVSVLEVEDGTYVAVSTPYGLERFKVKTKGLDPDNLLLLRR